MLIKKKGKVITFDCNACGCEFIVGVNVSKNYDGNFYCNCPMCGSECHTDWARQEMKKENTNDR